MEYRAGRYDEAMKASIRSKRVNLVGVVVGLCLIFLFIGTVVVINIIAYETGNSALSNSYCLVFYLYCKCPANLT